jgi:hypothetical protein
MDKNITRQLFGESNILCAIPLVNIGNSYNELGLYEKAKENFGNVSCKYRSLSNYSALIREARDTAYITDVESVTLSNWNSDPQNWYQNNF